MTREVRAINAATTCGTLLLLGTLCIAQTVTLPNDVVLGDQYFDFGGKLGRELTFGQGFAWVADDFVILDRPLSVGIGFLEVSPGDVLDQVSYRSFPGFPRFFGGFQPGEEAYVGYGTKVIEVELDDPLEVIGWMHIKRTDEGILEVLGSAANYGPLLEDGMRGPASGITVGTVAEPSSCQLCFVVLLVATYVRERQQR